MALPWEDWNQFWNLMQHQLKQSQEGKQCILIELRKSSKNLEKRIGGISKHLISLSIHYGNHF